MAAARSLAPKELVAPRRRRGQEERLALGPGTVSCALALSPARPGKPGRDGTAPAPLGRCRNPPVTPARRQLHPPGVLWKEQLGCPPSEPPRGWSLAVAGASPVCFLLRESREWRLRCAPGQGLAGAWVLPAFQPLGRAEHSRASAASSRGPKGRLLVMTPQLRSAGGLWALPAFSHSLAAAQ